MDQIEGFRMYLETAEGELLNQLHPPELTPERFEKYLPYALALDVENAWSEKFSWALENAATGPGDNDHHRWYEGRHYDTYNFADQLSQSMDAAISSASSPPGSSGGGGGGGSSGGGWQSLPGQISSCSHKWGDSWAGWIKKFVVAASGR